MKEKDCLRFDADKLKEKLLCGDQQNKELNLTLIIQAGQMSNKCNVVHREFIDVARKETQ